MQITLIQSEIEEALTAYIHSQITVKEGQKITIELKATRGAEGTTAVIDIVADKGGVAEPVRPAANSGASKPATDKPKAEVKAKAEVKPEVVEDKPDTAEDTAADSNALDQATEAGDVANNGDASADDAGQSGEAGVADAGEAEAAADPAPAKKSLFAGLQRPKND